MRTYYFAIPTKPEHRKAGECVEPIVLAGRLPGSIAVQAETLGEAYSEALAMVLRGDA